MDSRAKNAKINAKNRNDCIRTNIEDPPFIVTWISDEIGKSLEFGYKIVDVYVKWQVEITQYKPNESVQNKRTTDLSAVYMDS